LCAKSSGSWGDRFMHSLEYLVIQNAFRLAVAHRTNQATCFGETPSGSPRPRYLITELVQVNFQSKEVGVP